MSERILASLGLLTSYPSPVGGAAVTSWTDRVAALIAQGVTVHRWGRSEDTSGTVYNMAVGVDGTIVNPATGDYAQGALLENSGGGSSIGLSGSFPDPTRIQIPTVNQATWELTAFIQLDQVKAGTLLQVNSGAAEAGCAECKLISDGAGGLKFRFESCAVAASRVIKEGSSLAQIPVGQTVMLSYVRTAADMECHVNGTARTITLVAGTLATWPAPAAGTTYLGAFVDTSGGSSGGVDCLLGEFLITSPLTPTQRAFLAAHSRRNIVAALNLAGGEIDEGALAENYSILQSVHPATGSVTISSPPSGIGSPSTSIGSATVGPNAIVYEPPASVSSDTPVTIGYTYTVGAVTTAEALLSLTVNNVVVPPPPPSTLPEDDELPTPLATKTANNSVTFDSVVGGAQPGDRINLGSANYGGKTISVNGTAANPIVVRASTLHGAVFSSLNITGNWIIVSAVDVNPNSLTSNAVTFGGGNNRITRSLVRNCVRSFSFNAGAHDILIDHCNVNNVSDRGFNLADPKNQRRITFARCWVHTLVAGGTLSTCHFFSWNEENQYREQPFDTVVRFNYIGPGEASGGSSDFLHHKGSKSIYAFNRWVVNGVMSHRFGLRTRSVGNYITGSGVAVRAYDDLGWYYGNSVTKIECTAGKSAYYDDTKNQPFSVGGFHATTRCRLAGNSANIELGTLGTSGNFCSGQTVQGVDDGTLPDPQPAGGIKPARTSGGVTYAAEPVNALLNGIKIRASTGTVTTLPPGSGGACGGSFAWADNVDSAIGTVAPSAWRTELFTEYPWIEAICPNPTSLTGGPGASGSPPSGGAAPWSIAQELQRGDVATPTANTCGPRRTTGGGLP